MVSTFALCDVWSLVQYQFACEQLESQSLMERLQQLQSPCAYTNALSAPVNQ